MHPTALLFLAASASASYHGAIHPGALAAKRDLVARQSSTDDGSGDSDAATSCIADILSIYQSLPTPPPDLVSWESETTITDPCSITVPASLSSAFSSYESEALSWWSDHSSEILEAISTCPLFSSINTEAGQAPACTAAGGSGTGSGPVTTTTDDDDTSTTSTGISGAASGDETALTTRTSGAATGSTGTTTRATGTNTASGSGAGAAATQSQNAGPRETGFVAGVVAVAGFLGVVAAL